MTYKVKANDYNVESEDGVYMWLYEKDLEPGMIVVLFPEPCDHNREPQYHVVTSVDDGVPEFAEINRLDDPIDFQYGDKVAVLKHGSTLYLEVKDLDKGTVVEND